MVYLFVVTVLLMF